MNTVPQSLTDEITRLFAHATHKWQIGEKHEVVILRHNPETKKGKPKWFVLKRGDLRAMIIEFEERKGRFVFRSVTNAFGNKMYSHVNGKKQYIGMPDHLIFIPVLETVRKTINKG